MSNTIKMWGSHLNSPETQNKLRYYRLVKRKAPTKFKDSIIAFDFRLDKPLPKGAKIDHAPFIQENVSAKLKRAHYQKVLDPKTLSEPFETEPYTDILLLPKGQRPSTLGACIDFFYPLSGPTSYIPTQSALTSTHPGAYTQEYNYLNVAQKQALTKELIKFHNRQNVSKNDMPVDLGDVTMMYTWFIMYRLLLCPNSFTKHIILPEPSKLFGVNTEDKDGRLLFEKELRAKARNVGKLRTALGGFKKGVSVATNLAKGVASGKIKDFNSFILALRSDPSVKKFIQAGTGHFSKQLSRTFGISPTTANSVSSWVVQRAVTPETYSKLPNDTKSMMLTFAETTLNEQIKKLGVGQLSNSELGKLRMLIVNGDMSKVDFDSLSSKAKEIALDYVEEKKEVYLGNFKKAFEQLKDLTSREGARSNGIGASLVIDSVGSIIKYQLDREVRLAQEGLDKSVQYFTTLTQYLNPNLSEPEVSFALDTFKNKGLKTEGRWDVNFGDQSWDSMKKPYCTPLNGGLVAEYVTNLYEIFKPLIEKMKVETLMGNSPNVRDILKESSTILRSKGINVNRMRSTWPCWTFDIFVKNYNAIRSTQYVFRDITHFSPFTQAYGFEPAFLRRSKLQNYELKELNRDWGANTDLVISGSPYENGWTYASSYKGGYFTPGMPQLISRLNTASDEPSRNVGRAAWETSKLEKLKWSEFGSGIDRKGNHNKTINSQRRITDEATNGYFGFTDIGFDAAYKDANGPIPIMNAQWPALLSVLYCYPEALETMSVGYTWAQDLKRRRHNLESKRARDALSRASSNLTKNFVLPNFNKNFVLPKIPSLNLKTLNEGSTLATEDNKQKETPPKSENKESDNFALYTTAAVLGLSFLGAGAYLYKKKKRGG